MELKPGQWTATGWGARHRVRRSDEQWTELVCHTRGNRCETARINQSADERQECYRCRQLVNLGPIQLAPLGEVRRDETGLMVVCSGRIERSRRWSVIGEDPVPGAYGWRDDWDVARFTVLGNVYDFTASIER